MGVPFLGRKSFFAAARPTNSSDMPASPDTTAMLIDLRGGNRTVVDRLFPVVYDELQQIAHRLLVGERSGHTMSTTALVHEAYFRLVDQSRVQWQDRAHFCAVAAKAMRRILIDYARRRRAIKRGGGQQPVSLDEQHAAVEAQAELLLSVDQALESLEKLSDRLARIVELRFFGGMTEEEMAEVLEVSPRTVRRDWVKARAWLYREMYPEKL
jgi:RNA polymerase sigma factor (TIGR02999 family)